MLPKRLGANPYSASPFGNACDGAFPTKNTADRPSPLLGRSAVVAVWRRPVRDNPVSLIATRKRRRGAFGVRVIAGTRRSGSTTAASAVTPLPGGTDPWTT